MTLDKRIEAFANLGTYMRRAGEDPDFLRVAEAASSAHPFFRVRDILQAVSVWGDCLREPALREWLEPYFDAVGEGMLGAGYNPAKRVVSGAQAPSIPSPAVTKTIRVIMAGNIPLVGFHDYLCVLMAGHRLQAKLSSKDALLLPFFHKKLLETAPQGCDFEAEFGQKFKEEPDAVIATGSASSNLYFEYNYGRYPHLLRSNRGSIAILDGTETPDELYALTADILQYFGLGCRSVSKLYVPKNYDFTPLVQAQKKRAEEWGMSEHETFKDNYRYQKALLSVCRTAFIDAEPLILQASNKISSPLAVLYYETYTDPDDLWCQLEARTEEIQCLVGHGPQANLTPFGRAQHPALNDYADDVDTLRFLLK